MTNGVLSRRRFLRGGFLTSSQSRQFKQRRFDIIRPPWSVEESEFVADCTRCGDCIDVCETRILIKGGGDFPEVDFSAGECTFCRRCAETCTQPVFRPTKTTPWQHKVDIAAHCLTRQRIECRSCDDSCETRAIRFIPTFGGIAKIGLNTDRCNGCGACIRTCPVAAINVHYPQENRQE